MNARVPGAWHAGHLANLVPRAGHQTQAGCTRAEQPRRACPTGLGGCPLLGGRPTRCLGTLVSTKGNSEAGLTTLAVGLASGIPGEALAGVTGGEGPGPGTSQALNGGAGEGSVPAGAPATVVCAASLRTVLWETHQGRSWLTPASSHCGFGVPWNPVHPREATACQGRGRGAWEPGDKHLETEVALPASSTPSPRRPEAPAPPTPSPWLLGLQGDTKVFRDQVATWVLFLQWGQAAPGNLFQFGGPLRGLWANRAGPLKEATRVPRPWAA